MRKKKLNQGITLIALVITIIVLLILAGVSISMVSGDNGIAKKAKQASEKTNKSSQIEEIQLEITNVTVENEGSISEEEFEDILKTYGTLSSEEELLDRTLTTKKDGTKIKVIEIYNGTLTKSSNASVTLSLTSGSANITAVANVSDYDGDVAGLNYTFYLKTPSSTEYVQKQTGTSATYTTGSLSSGTHYFKVEVRENVGGKILCEKSDSKYFDAPVCFVAGTKVLTETGLKNIEEINLGDRVYSINLDNNQRELKEVTSLHVNRTNVIYRITIGEDVVETTARHQFYIQDKGWIRAYDLEKGDRITAKDDSSLEINNIEVLELEEPRLVYNLTVEGYHNYLVTEYELLVHNAGSK